MKLAGRAEILLMRVRILPVLLEGQHGRIEACNMSEQGSVEISNV